MFELLLHEAFHRLGHVLEPHPELKNGKTSRPDFLVTTREGGEFYLEAVLVSEDNDMDNAGQARIDMLIDALNQAPHRNFALSFECTGYPSTQPSSNQLLKELHTWLDELDPDRIREQGLDATATFRWSHEEGWEAVFMPMSLQKEMRGQSERLIWIENGRGGIVDRWSPIHRSLRKKGNKYGKLDKPLLVAVNTDSLFLTKDDEEQALYGQELIAFDPERPARLIRARNGLWTGGARPSYQRISGVLIFNNLDLPSIPRVRPTLYFNPWTQHVLPDSMKEWPHAIANNNELRRSQGISVEKLFGVSANWPEN
ncbi:hypothetical protein NR756_04805 [Alloalcanivorax xenomutans]|uniref:hypothetical protein n=1 Tax=Alloalcanivorax xenomutans TaxID=1094342 RepID=UPI0011C0324B